MRYVTSFTQLLVPILIALVSVPCYGQTQVTNVGKNIYVTPGTRVTVIGDVDNNSSGIISNKGVISITGDFDNSAKYKHETGKLLFEGSSVQTFTSNGDSVYNLAVDKTDGRVVLADPVVVMDSLVLLNFNVQSTATNFLKLSAGAEHSGGSALSFVDGPLDIEATGDVEFPIGKGVNFRPVVLTNLSGTSPTVRFEAIDGATGGTAGLGIDNLSNTRYWEGTKISGAYADADNITIGFGGDDNVTALASVRIGQSGVLAGTYESIGNSATTGAPASGTVTSDSVKVFGGAPKYFVLGDCENVPGAADGYVNLICQGDTNTLFVTDYTPGASLQWEYSNDGVSYALVPGATNDTLLLKDTLNATKHYRVGVTGLGCANALSNAYTVTVNPSLKVKLRVILEGAYDALGDTMYHGDNGLNGVAGYHLNNQYLYGGASTLAQMYRDYPVPDGAVDVVEIELWRDTDADAFPDLEVDSTFGWVMKDGEVRNFYNGQTQYMNLCDGAVNNYFIFVRHRNHLPIMSAVAQAINTTVPGAPIDLTVVGNVYGNEVGLLEAGVWGMWAGNVYNTSTDLNEINAQDLFRVRVQSLAPPVSGWYQQDVTLDGYVNSADYLITSTNNDDLYYSSVPE